jgi:hypothetical protein
LNDHAPRNRNAGKRIPAIPRQPRMSELFPSAIKLPSGSRALRIALDCGLLAG